MLCAPGKSFKNILRLALLGAAVLTGLSQAVLAQSDRGFGDPNRAAGGGGSGGAVGDFVPQLPTVVGGEVPVGGGAQVVVLFRNDSGQPISSGAIQLYPASTVSATVSLNQCVQEPLPPGAVCAVAVNVKGLQPGPWRVEMLMRHSGRSRLVTATMTGTVATGDAAADKFKSDVEAIPDELAFGSLKASQPLVRAVVLRNITSTAIDINAVYIEASDQSGYALRTDCTRLDPGQACVVTVTWSPILAGQATGVLLIEHSGPTSVASVNLTGDFTPEDTEEAKAFPEAVPGKGLLVSSQDQIDFGSGIASTSAITVSLVNVGDAPLSIRDIRLASSDSGGLTVARSGCMKQTVLDPIEACPLTITWSPVREGAIIDDIQVVHDGARGVLVLPVRGSSKIVISQDSKPVRLAGTETATILAGDGASVGDVAVFRDDSIDPASVLDGFVVTSHSPKRAIINGPGGSRIVFDGEEVVIGGFLWYVNMRSSGIEFRSGAEKVLLLFDRSLSSVNRGRGQSGGGSSAGSGTGSTGSSSSGSSSTSTSGGSSSTPAASTASTSTGSASGTK